ncbi:hypothetical protein [Camelimonas lactis]|uniref:Uncharacterized protein n=1 Tax=Camelimonas lactis TaxID=659006 RepID=A0A4R2GW46_9HYPH|nr:hypothetical protein [Camelimonas lactis]TCO15219.1 hypothetical protein EV666_102197 [Camelimonas lactis]
MAAKPRKTAGNAAATPAAASSGGAAGVADLRRYPVLSPLDHDGVRYAPANPDADEILLTPDDALRLQELGVLGAELA